MQDEYKADVIIDGRWDQQKSFNERIEFRIDPLIRLYNTVAIKADNQHIIQNEMAKKIDEMEKINDKIISGIFEEMRSSRAVIADAIYSLKNRFSALETRFNSIDNSIKPDFPEIGEHPNKSGFNFYFAFQEMLKG